MTKQKIKNLIILTVIVSILSISCIFYRNINIFIHNFMFNNKIITSENNLLVHFISVGQGDAIAINFPSGKTMLIDTGGEYKSVDYANYIKNDVIGNSISNKIDYLVLTHADADHVGGTFKLLQNFEIGKIYLPQIDGGTETYLEVKQVVTSQCENAVFDYELDIEEAGVKISCYQLEEVEDTNNSSPLIKIEYLNTSFLFAGDLSIEAEDEILENCPFDVDSDVLKVAHHGSKESSGEEFLKEVSPKFAVISVGDNNYGHPTQEVLDRLGGVDAKVLRTDTDGNILFAVGEYYENSYICGNVYITNIVFDYRICVLFGDVVLLAVMAIIVFKPAKRSPNK